MTNQGKGAIDIVLADSFKELAATKPIEKITIKEITDRAGVIRPTFYNHFQDKYELLEWIVENELVAPSMPIFENGMFKEGAVFILTRMEKEKDFYKKAAALEGQNSFKEILQHSIERMIVKFMDVNKLMKMIHCSWMTPELLAEFYGSTICASVIKWINTNMHTPIDETVDAFTFLFTNSIVDLMKKTL